MIKHTIYMAKKYKDLNGNTPFENNKSPQEVYNSYKDLIKQNKHTTTYTLNEVLLNIVGVLIINGEILPKDVRIFDLTSNREMYYEENGIIKDWEVGYFSFKEM